MKLGFSMWGAPDVPVAEVFPVVAAMGYQGGNVIAGTFKANAYFLAKD